MRLLGSMETIENNLMSLIGENQPRRTLGHTDVRRVLPGDLISPLTETQTSEIVNDGPGTVRVLVGSPATNALEVAEAFRQVVDATGSFTVAPVGGRAQLARAIETLGVVELTHRGFQDPLRFFYEAPETLSAEDLAADSSGNFEVSAALGEHLLSILVEREKAEKNYARNRVVSWARSMAELAKALGGTAGRKNVVLFTEGFDGSLAFGRDASRWPLSGTGSAECPPSGRWHRASPRDRGAACSDRRRAACPSTCAPCRRRSRSRRCCGPSA